MIRSNGPGLLYRSPIPCPTHPKSFYIRHLHLYLHQANQFAPRSSPIIGPHSASWFRTTTILGWLFSVDPLSATRWVSWAPGRHLTPGHQGLQAVVLDSWVGNSGTDLPPLARRSSGRRRRAVGLQWSGTSD